MVNSGHSRSAVVAGLIVLSSVSLRPGLSAAPWQEGGRDAKESDKRPRISVKAQPPVAIAPARVVLTAELQGGANDFEEYYCPTIEWEWGDDTRSESTSDCPPFEAGKSEIRRRFTVEHVFRRSGVYKVFFRLKRRDKAVGTGTINIQVRPGGPEF